MSKNPKFLLLEDAATDAELIMDEVKTVFPDCSFSWVGNEPDFIKELTVFKPDLILTDYSLPGYNGMSALKYTLKNAPDTPVILVTGSINEETAVSCMKTGAVDYVLKDKMNRLGLAVKTALENKNIKIKEQKAQDEIKKLSTALEQSPVAITILDKKANIEYSNPAFQKLSGYTQDELIGVNMVSFTSGQIDKNAQTIIINDLLKGTVISERYLNKNKKGEDYWVAAKIAPFKNSSEEITGFIELQEDITQRIQNEERIENDLKEKELLLQEIYHRVNNNMQIMISLFNMQIEKTDLQSEKDILKYAQSRIGAMSAIHSDIYQERSFIAINFANVTRHVFNNLCDSLLVEPGNIKLVVDAEIPDFGLDLAQPCALIVNELLSNTIRHAYPQGKGLVFVSLSINKTEEIILTVKDNGIGLPRSLDPENSNTTGLSLVNLLGKGQLDGTVNFNGEKGTTVTVKFKRIEDKKRF